MSEIDKTGELLTQRETALEELSGGRGGILRTMAILLITGVCGWMVMQLEILGGRMLTPYFGSNIYVTWGSVIGVFLLSLSVGYLLGGWLSRTAWSKVILGANIAVAGGWLCLIPWMLEPVSYYMIDAGLSVKVGALFASIVLFSVPTVLLGTVSPTAVRWLTREADESGLSAGMVYAFSTGASFAGCVVTAFYLVMLSARGTNRVSGAVLILVGGSVLLHAGLQWGRRRRVVKSEEVN